LSHILTSLSSKFYHAPARTSIADGFVALRENGTFVQKLLYDFPSMI
jgi:hypothetical protein